MKIGVLGREKKSVNDIVGVFWECVGFFLNFIYNICILYLYDV